MGATPQSALAYVTLPLAAPALMQRDLTQLLAGAIATLNAAGALLVGGHTSEGAELALALAVNGHVEPGQMRAKDNPQAGDVLVLSKALGTGMVMAAEMRGLARSEWLDACVAQMLTTHATAAAELARFEVHALTDVTGFGLAGHLAEMLRRGGLQARLQLGALPVLPGASELSAQGVRSSLHRQNERLIPAITVADRDTSPDRYALLFDPQTSGGLLLALPAAQAPACVAALRAVGYTAAAIGYISAT
jgi:selenide,water dikinase